MKGFLSVLKRAGVPEGYPCVLIGSWAKEVRQNTEIPIRKVSNAYELLEIVSQYMGVENLEYPLIIDDLSYISQQAQQSLLKFLEETSLRVVLLSSYDVIGNALLSRIRVFAKKANEKTQSNFVSPAKGRERIENMLSEDSHYLDKIRYEGKESPIIYYNEKLVPGRSNRKKLLDLIEMG